MKRYILAISAVLLALSSCNKEAEVVVVTPSEDNTPTVVNLVINLNEEQEQNLDDADLRYVVEAYSDSNYSTPATLFDGGTASSLVSTANTISMTVEDGEEYHLLLWADDGQTYEVDELSNVTLASGYDQFAEAWQARISIADAASSNSHTATLSLAVAKVNLVETEQIESSSLVISYDTYSTFNVVTGDTEGSVQNFQHTYVLESGATGQLNDEPIYIIAPVEAADVVDFSIEVDGGEQIVSNVTIQASYTTTITGHFDFEADEDITNTLVISTVADWASSDDDGTIVIRSVDELMRYIKIDNINAKMAPGTYQITTETSTTYGREIDSYNGDVAVIVFEGDNSTYDFTDVRFEISTDILRTLGNNSFYTIHLQSANTYLQNLEIEFIGESYNYSGGAAILMDGSDNTIDGFDLTTRGSYPYGYGDLFGKGSSYVIKHYKHCGILIRGDRPTLKNTSVHQFSYGHAVFCQGSVDALIENCYVESELRTTDEVLAEVGTAAANVDFMTDWGYKVPPGYKFSCCEEGFRAYSTGHVLGTDGSRNTTNTTVRDSRAFQTRSGYVLHFSSGTRLAENCSAIDCETGYGIGNGTMVNCEGNSNIGLLFVVPYSTNSGSTVDLKILSSTHENSIYGEHKLLAYIAGSNHTYTFTEDVDEKQECHDKLEIMFGGDRTGLRFINSENTTVTDNLSATSIKLTNQTYYPIIFASNAKSNTVTTKGSWTDNGTSNTVTLIE